MIQGAAFLRLGRRSALSLNVAGRTRPVAFPIAPELSLEDLNERVREELGADTFTIQANDQSAAAAAEAGAVIAFDGEQGQVPVTVTPLPPENQALGPGLEMVPHAVPANLRNPSAAMELAGAPVQLAGKTTLREILDLGTTSHIVKRLKSNPRSAVTVAEFESLCQDHGMSTEAAHLMLHRLHAGGQVLWFSEHPDPAVAGRVFLRPSEVIDRLFGALGLEGPSRKFMRRQRERKEAQLDALRSKYHERLAAKQLVDREAAIWTTVVNRAGFVGLLGGIGFYAYLTFDLLSWDVMEPATWVTGVAFTTAAYWWWFFTNRELEYGTVDGWVRHWRRDRLFRGVLERHGMLQEALQHAAEDADALEEGETGSLARLRRLLPANAWEHLPAEYVQTLQSAAEKDNLADKPVAKDAVDYEALFDSLMEGMKAQVHHLEEEIRLLDHTNFNPALLSVLDQDDASLLSSLVKQDA